MFAQFTADMEVHTKALVLRAERQRLIASNIANADTPGYIAHDLNFKQALEDSTQTTASQFSNGAKLRLDTRGVTRSPSHMELPKSADSQLMGASALAYTVQSQPAADGNSVDLDRERANFVDNSVRYESTLRFISGQSKTILSAIQGQ
jgi:flagellar basal-body rod protein FlgB